MADEKSKEGTQNEKKGEVKQEEKKGKERKGLSPQWLKGLTFRGAQMKKVKTDQGEKERSVPFERDLTPEDVLDWTDKGDSVIIVTADGQKYQVKKEKEK